MRRLAFSLAALGAMVLVAAAAGIGAEAVAWLGGSEHGGRWAAGGLAAAAGALGWTVLRKARERLFAARPADAHESLDVAAARVLYLVVAVAIVLAALRAPD